MSGVLVNKVPRFKKMNDVQWQIIYGTLSSCRNSVLKIKVSDWNFMLIHELLIKCHTVDSPIKLQNMVLMERFWLG